jgi:putative transposase
MKSLLTRTSPRRSDYDYTSSGAYFVTICTADRQHYFGEIEDGETRLNELWVFATEHRNHVSDHYPFVETREFVCMPNHIHGIILIGERSWNRDVGMRWNECPWGAQFLASDIQNQNVSDRNKKIDILKWNNDVGTQFLASEEDNIDMTWIDDHDRTYKNTSLQPPPSWSLGAIIRGYKIWITKYAKQLNLEFKRQWRYYDHIIRNEKEYNAIKYYIQTNPQKRWEDIFYDW